MVLCPSRHLLMPHGGGPFLIRSFWQRRRVDAMSVPGRNIKWISGQARSGRDPYSNSERRNSHLASKVVKPFELCQPQRAPRSQFPESRHSSSDPRQKPKIHSRARRGNTDAKPVETTGSENQRRRTDLRYLRLIVAPGEGNCAVCNFKYY